jgi:hypothetical protein
MPLQGITAAEFVLVMAVIVNLGIANAQALKAD